MTARLLSFLACVAAGAAVGWGSGSRQAAALGALAGAIAWFAVESLRALRVLRWLRRGDFSRLPAVGGAWLEAADRMRRAVTLREKRAAEAERQLDDFRSAIRGSPNGVVLLDAQGRIEWCNDTAAAQLGLDPQRDLLQHLGNLVRDPDFAAFYGSRNYDRDVVVSSPVSPAGRPLRLALRLHPYGEGRLLLLSRDVTAVEQADTMRRDFVANVSHEIRTPLTVLAGFVETMQSLDLAAAERARYLQMMAQQAHRMQMLVNDLLTLSRLEGSPLPGTGDWLPAAHLLAQAREDGEQLAASLGKQLDLRFLPAPEAAIAGAPLELQSALSNLVGNAVRYTPAGGSIEVDAHLLPAGRLAFDVRDTGPGIAPEHLPRLTERFYRVDRSRSRETGGTGLGLAIVKHVVQRHGGELRIESTPGAGSTFAIELPASRVRLMPAGTTEQPATESAAG
ncbi:MAG: phosphate regulon sensor histidine kinase PhoR [Ramlibacter sp.]